MVMSSTTLANQFISLPNVDNEASAILNMTDAFIVFFSEMSCMGIPCVPAILQTTPKLALAAGMTGLSTDAPTAIQSGIQAFWAACAPLAATIFPAAVSLTPPPSISLISSTILPIGQANISGNLDKTSACTAIASAIYSLNLGGIAIITVPPPQPFPIL